MNSLINKIAKALKGLAKNSIVLCILSFASPLSIAIGVSLFMGIGSGVSVFAAGEVLKEGCKYIKVDSAYKDDVNCYKDGSLTGELKKCLSDNSLSDDKLGSRVSVEVCNYGESKLSSSVPCDIDCSAKVFTCIGNAAELNSNNDCAWTSCGNGVVEKEEKETCDVGNAWGIGGCSKACQTMVGWDCSNPQAFEDDVDLMCDPICGDGNTVWMEECDLGDNNGEDKGCDKDCKVSPKWKCENTGVSLTTPGTTTCEQVACGNGKLETVSGEACDDGNSNNNDGCDSLCRVQTGWVCSGSEGAISSCSHAPFCGDGTKDSGESCDDGNTVNGDKCSAQCMTSIPPEICWLNESDTKVCETAVASADTCDQEFSPYSEDFYTWACRPWHNGDVTIRANCDGDYQLIGSGMGSQGSGCFSGSCSTSLAPIEKRVAKNDEYDLCVSDEAGNEATLKVLVNWIDKLAPKFPVEDPTLPPQPIPIYPQPEDPENGTLYIQSQDSPWRPLNTTQDTIIEAHKEVQFILAKVEDPVKTSENGQSGFYADRKNFLIKINGPETGSSLEQTAFGDLGSISGVEYDASSKVIKINDDSDIFEKIGPYTIEVIVKDRAMNEVSSGTLKVLVVASEASDEKSEVTLDYACSDGSLLANNQDKCSGTIFIKDRFGNVIHGNQTVIDNRLSPREEIAQFTHNTSGPLSVYAPNSVVANAAFENGLRWGEGNGAVGTSIPNPVIDNNVHKYTFYSDAGRHNFSFTAMIPTIEVLESSNSHLHDAYLSKKITRGAYLKFRVQAVGHDGQPTLGEYTEVIRSLDTQFDPWIKAQLSNRSNGGTVAPFQFLIGPEQTIYAIGDTEHVGKFFPSNCSEDLNTAIWIKGQHPPDTEFNDEDLNPTEIHLLPGERRVSIPVRTHLRVMTGPIKDINVAFTSHVRYGVREGSICHVIKYPGGNLGNQVGEEFVFNSDQLEDGIKSDNTDVSGIVIGADIEGQILTRQTDEFVTHDTVDFKKTNIIQMGNVTTDDIREDVTRNAYKLIRNKASVSGVVDLSNLTDGGVLYYKGGSVRLIGDTVGPGRHTIIIEDGNLFIENDFDYATTGNNSLGFILINSNQTQKPTTGNIFIKNKVKHFVGTYFADGSIMSTTKENPGINDGTVRDTKAAENPNTGLGRQLILDGTLFTRNTFGGAMVEGEYLNPWGRESDRDGAQKYDLHFMRRYYPRQGDPSYANRYCVKDSNNNCDPNKHAFVIRPDGRVQNNPPPGFSK